MTSVSSSQMAGKSLLSVVETRFEDASRSNQTCTRLIWAASFGDGVSFLRAVGIGDGLYVVRGRLMVKCW